MKHKTIVRLALRLMGVYLLAIGLPTAVSQAANVAMKLSGSANSPMTGNDWSWLLPSVLYGGTQIVLGAYLLFGGRLVVNTIVPSNRPYCPECSYELRPPISAHCPECGASLQSLLTRAAEPDSNARS